MAPTPVSTIGSSVRELSSGFLAKYVVARGNGSGQLFPIQFHIERFQDKFPNENPWYGEVESFFKMNFHKRRVLSMFWSTEGQ